MNFTIDSYRDWPDSFEQSARDRAEREARKKQMPLFAPLPSAEANETSEEVLCERAA